MEEVVYDRESGQLLTASFMEYAIPRADTLPDMVIGSNPVPTALNPLGAKGAGEAGTVGALPAVMNAVIDALAPLGVGIWTCRRLRSGCGVSSRTPGRPRQCGTVSAPSRCYGMASHDTA